MFDYDAIIFSPSGRYACRKKYFGDTEGKRREVFFFDLQKETCYEMRIVIVGNYCIRELYWLDDSHFVVIFSQDYHIARDNKKVINRPKKALYKVDLNKQELEPIKIDYWREDETTFPMFGFVLISNGFLTVNDNEYSVFTKDWEDWLETERDTTYDDLESLEMFNGNRDDFIWLRFIPKTFENVPEIEKVWINHGDICRAANINFKEHSGFRNMTAHKHKLYLIFGGEHILVLDMDKYFNVLRETTTPPASSNFCEILNIGGSMSYEKPYFYQNGLLYLKVLGENDIVYTRIWDIDENMVTGYFMVDKEVAFADGERVYHNIHLHPSGHFLQIPHETSNCVSYVVKACYSMFAFITKKFMTFNLIPIKSIRAQVNTLRQLATNQVVLNKSRNRALLPRFLREGKTRLDIPSKEPETYDLSDWFTYVDELS